MELKKYIYQLADATILYLDTESEQHKDRFVMLASVSEEEMLYGEIIRDPLPRITLETMEYNIYKATDLEYNRNKCLDEINTKRRFFLKEKTVSFIFDEIPFDGNDLQTTVSSKENIMGIYTALNSLPIQYRSEIFPLTWKTYDNGDYVFETYDEFILFYNTFTIFRMLYEKNVNEKCFIAKSSIIQSTNINTMKKAVEEYIV